jgi:hypothetical protein
VQGIQHTCTDGSLIWPTTGKIKLNLFLLNLCYLAKKKKKKKKKKKISRSFLELYGYYPASSGAVVGYGKDVSSVYTTLVGLTAV